MPGIKIGNEVIAYAQRQGNILMGGNPIPEYDVDGNPTGNYFPNGLVRGARASATQTHDLGAAVMFWGYSVMLQADTLSPNLPAVKGRVESKIGPNTGRNYALRIWKEDEVNSDYDNYVDEGPEAGLPEDFDRVCANEGVFDDFPDSGFLLVYGDVIEEYVKDEVTGHMRAQFADPRRLGEILFYDGKGNDTTKAGTAFDFLSIRQRNAIPWQGNPANALAIPAGGYHFRNNTQFMLVSLELDDVYVYHKAGGYIFLRGNSN